MLASALALLSTAALPLRAQSRPVLRLLTHDSFELPPELLKRFEAEAGVQLQIVKGGDAGEMLNRLILTRRKPLADLVFGIDNALLPRAFDAGVLDAYDGPAARRPAVAPLEGGVVPVDFGFVALNIDRAWFASRNRALPTSLQELATPAWRNLLVVQNPATSSPGQAFLQATIAGLGEEAAFDWWARMRANGVKVVRGWTEAYYTEFTRNGGTRPIVVSYAGSPAAEVFFADKPLETSPTASLFLPGGVFRQVEGVALVKGGNPAAREAAGKFIEFLRSAPAQQALQTTMWMYPAEAGAARVDVMKTHAVEPTAFDNPSAADVSAKNKAWLQRWTKTVVK